MRRTMLIMSGLAVKPLVQLKTQLQEYIFVLYLGMLKPFIFRNR